MTNPTEEVKLPELEHALHLLAISMRHSAGQWMVPGWDGHKVSDLLEKAKAAIQAQAAEHAAQVRRIRDIRNENAEDDRAEIRQCRQEIAALKKERDGLVDQYMRLAEAMHYTSGKDGMEFSPEEWAAAVHVNAERYHWLRSGVRLRQGVAVSGQRYIDRSIHQAKMRFDFWCSPDELDAAIDAARQTTREQP